MEESPQKTNEKIINRLIEDEMKQSYLDYSMSVIVGRALPDVRDGLKPVHRRILFAMNDMAMHHNKPFKKSARIVGECFVKDTMVLTNRGLVQIQDIKQDDLVFTQKGPERVTQLYIMPKRKLLKIRLENGVENIATTSQKFKVLNEDWTFTWKQADELSDRDYIVVKSSYPAIKEEFQFEGKSLNENIAYLLGQLISDGWVENTGRICFYSTSQPIIKKIFAILEEEFYYTPTIETIDYEHETKQGLVLLKKGFQIRINNKSINKLLTTTFNLLGIKAKTKIIPSQIFQSPKNVIFSFISGLIDGDGSIHKERNVIQYGTISSKLSKQLLIILQHLGIYGKEYVDNSLREHIINGRIIRKKEEFFSLEFSGKNAQILASNLKLADELKSKRLLDLLNKKLGKSNYEILPYCSKLFEELSKNHLGGGWYMNSLGDKFRSGIKYASGAKIRYCSDLNDKPLRISQIIEWGIKEKLKKIGSDLYEFLDNTISENIFFIKVEKIEEYREDITYDIQVEKEHEFIANSMVVHNCLGKYHPHGDVAVYDSMVRMAQDWSLRYTLVQGQGNFGCFTKDTEIALADGRDLSFEKLIKEYKQGKRNYTYTINEEGFIEIAEIKNPRLTKKSQGILKIILDNGEEIKCTLDHRFMLRSKAYKKAKDLKLGDSLMPLYLKSSTEKDKLKPSLREHKTVVRVEFLNQKEDVFDITIDKTHNFALAAGIFVHNSIDGDSPAAMRYTECRLNKLSEDILADLDKETVEFVPNFDNSLKEPSVLPSKIPNLLVNGSSGIAVGMATNIPPHNITEVCDGITATIDNPEIDTSELFEIIKGPDFPTAGIICGRNQILEAYKYGRGKIIVRSKTELIEEKNKQIIIVSEIPYMVNKAETVKEIADLVNDKKIKGISDIRDESDREGIRIVIELSKDANPEVVLNQLFQHTRLQVTFGIIMLVLVNNQPKVLNLKELIQEYISYRQIIVRKRTDFDLKKAEERQHILIGLIIALSNIDQVIKQIKASKTVEDAKNVLMSDYKLTEIQSKAILDMKLQRLASLEQQKIKEEHDELTKQISELKKILADETEILKIIKLELEDIKKSYGDKRRTSILEKAYESFEEEELIKPEDDVITISHSGYVKRLPVALYRQQKRGGKGARAATTKEEDFIEDLFVANTHDHILFFTNKGKLHWLKVYELPEAGKQAKGSSISNLLHLAQDEKISAFVPVKDFSKGYLMMVTKNAVIKKTELSEFSNPRKGGIIAVNLRDNDELINVVHTSGNDQIILATKNGQAVRFNESDIRSMGRQATGVRGARLKGDDVLIDMVKADDTKTLLTITENGYGKRSAVNEYRLITRGGSGVINILCSERNGKVVSVRSVSDSDDLMFISKNGITIRTPAKDIRIIGRHTQGVRLMNLEEGDKVISATNIVKEDNEDENTDSNSKENQENIK